METFYSKVDSTYYAILGLYGIMSLSFCLFSKSMKSFVFVFALFVFIIIQLHAIKYRIDVDSEKLVVSWGIFYKSSLDINSIISIKKDNSMSAAPAASFDRLHIQTEKKALLISPKDQEDFLEAIKKINSDIIINI